MLTRILALPVVLLLAPSTLAPAHAHALSLESASPGIFAGNVDLLKEIPDLTHCCIKEKSTERSESSNRREEYLRARYMDPGQGRFLGIDKGRGADSRPGSLNDYSYAEGDPVDRVDPSGNESLVGITATERAFVSLVMQSVRTHAFDMVADRISSPLISSALRSGARLGGPSIPGNQAVAVLLTALAGQCRYSKRCLLRGMPVFVNGNEMAFSSLHVSLALIGSGNTSDGSPTPLPFMLNAISRRVEVTNRDSKPGCRGRSGALPVRLVCDEYPYAITRQGGDLNYAAGLVSLQFVPYAEGGTQGNKLKSFLRRARVARDGYSPGSLFISLAIPAVPTFYLDRRGKHHDL